MKAKKPFFYRIDAAALIDFATDPDGENISLLRFAKELQKGQSEISFIQSIIDEARQYIEKKKESGRKGGMAKASTAMTSPENALAKASEPLASSSSSSSSSTETKEKIKRFVIPSVEEITAYCKERMNSIDPQKFFDHYEARGWIPKGYTKQMKDWKAAVRTWEPNKLEIAPAPQKTEEEKKQADHEELQRIFRNSL